MTSESGRSKAKEPIWIRLKTNHKFEKIEKLLKKVLDKKSLLW